MCVVCSFLVVYVCLVVDSCSIICLCLSSFSFSSPWPKKIKLLSAGRREIKQQTLLPSRDEKKSELKEERTTERSETRSMNNVSSFDSSSDENRNQFLEGKNKIYWLLRCRFFAFAVFLFPSSSSSSSLSCEDRDRSGSKNESKREKRKTKGKHV